jgi:hypothetical protein
VTAPVEHRAVLRHRQVIAAAMAARSRATSMYWVTIVLMAGLLAAVWAGHTFSFWFVQQLPFAWMFAIGPDLPTVIPALFAFVVVVVVGALQQRAMGRAYLSNFTRLGIPTEIEALFEVLPEGLRLTTARITIFPRWPAVDTVERGADGWVVSADQLTFLVPADSFKSADDERAFVAAIVRHLTPEARERSGQAVEFAALEAPDPKPLEQSETLAGTHTAKARLTRQEASWAGRVGYDRIARTNGHAVLYPMLAAIVGGMLGLVAAGLLLVLLPLTITLGNTLVFAALAFVFPLIGGVAGLWLGQRRLGTIFDKAYHAELAQRGSPAEADCEWELGENGIVSRSARGDTTTRWEAINEVFRAGEFWIVLADVTALTIPRRAFADEAAERAFIAALLARLPQLARERSRDAAKFAAAS